MALSFSVMVTSPSSSEWTGLRAIVTVPAPLAPPSKVEMTSDVGRRAVEYQIAQFGVEAGSAVIVKGMLLARRRYDLQQRVERAAAIDGYG